MIKKLAITVGTALFLVGCGQNDNTDMGGAADNETGTGNMETEGYFGGVETGVNGTGASGNGSGGTFTTDNQNDPAPIGGSVSAATGAGQIYEDADNGSVGRAGENETGFQQEQGEVIDQGQNTDTDLNLDVGNAQDVPPDRNLELDSGDTTQRELNERPE